MCFSAEPNRKYYYHEEYVPTRQHQHHGHHAHHHHHHHDRVSVPRVAYVQGSPRVSTSSYRRSVPIVYTERTSRTSYR